MFVCNLPGCHDDTPCRLFLHLCANPSRDWSNCSRTGEMKVSMWKAGHLRCDPCRGEGEQKGAWDACIRAVNHVHLSKQSEWYGEWQQKKTTVVEVWEEYTSCSDDITSSSLQGSASMNGRKVQNSVRIRAWHLWHLHIYDYTTPLHPHPNHSLARLMSAITTWREMNTLEVTVTNKKRLWQTKRKNKKLQIFKTARCYTLYDNYFTHKPLISWNRGFQFAYCNNRARDVAFSLNLTRCGQSCSKEKVFVVLVKIFY